MTPIISVRNLKKVYRSFIPRMNVVAVDSISFDVNKGEVFGILGPNGSGKTTTLRMVLGLLRPTSGTVRLFNKMPQSLEVRKSIGYLPEKTTLYGFLNAFETLRLFGAMSGMSKRHAMERAEEILRRLDLGDARRRIGSYSKGMARKVAFAQAILADPELLILDEPTSGLDPLSAATVRTILEEMKSKGKTIVISSHILSDIQKMCDRVVIIAKGRIRAEGSLSSLLTREGYTRLVLKADPSQKEMVLKVLSDAGLSVERIENDTVELDKLFLEVLGKDGVGSCS
ncbi:MAG: ABC transporter ATP-binding protein [Planctomycetota bacterium]|nr:ABC transporter ATP-binding protein [Planctomycetota bacterium]